jgi:hypothetical protein
MTLPTDPTAAVRRSVYLLVGAVAVCVMAAKIVGAENVFEPSRYAPPTESSFGADRADKPTRKWPDVRPEPSPFFSSNDKSRWATIRALVDDGTYVVGRRADHTNPNPPYRDAGVIFENDYQSLDKVMNPTTGEFYSSKPPLLSTVLAGEYWVLKQAFGWGIVRDKWLVVCTILLTVNVLPFAVYLYLLAKLAERFGTTVFGRLFAFTLGALGTFLLTFGATLNNHNPAAYCALFAVYPLLRPPSTAGVIDPGPATQRPVTAETRSELAVSGFFAGLTACLDLPAAALTAALFVPLAWVRPGRTLLFFLPAMLIPIAGQFACNYAALGKLLPAYSDFGGPWYDYPGSHWKKWELVKAGQFVPGIDFNQEPAGVYAFHLLLGHHGWFSLTPAFLLSLVGAAGLMKSTGRQVLNVLGRAVSPAERVFTPALVGPMTLALSTAVFAFYLTRTQSYNYGGSTSGPRWLFWLIPLWVLCAAPAADQLGKWRAGRGAAALLLGMSVLSVFYPAWNPWRSPWIQQMCERAGWVSYEMPPAK